MLSATSATTVLSGVNDFDHAEACEKSSVLTSIIRPSTSSSWAPADNSSHILCRAWVAVGAAAAAEQGRPEEIPVRGGRLVTPAPGENEVPRVTPNNRAPLVHSSDCKRCTINATITAGAEQDTSRTLMAVRRNLGGQNDGTVCARVPYFLWGPLGLRSLATLSSESARESEAGSQGEPKSIRWDEVYLWHTYIRNR